MNVTYAVFYVSLLTFDVVLLDLAELLSSISDVDDHSRSDVNDSDRTFLCTGGMRTPSPVTLETLRSRSASLEVLRKRCGGWWCIICSCF